jgi:hypothetical protein
MSTLLIAIDSGSDATVAVTVAVMSGLTAIAAAVISGLYAKRSRTAEVEAGRIRDLEQRLSAKRYEVYQPMIDLLGQQFSGGPKDIDLETPEGVAEMGRRLRTFTAWVAVYGSDEAVRSFHNLMQAAFNDVPSALNIRLYGEFLIAARRDMGDRDTSLTLQEVLGLRINDLYTSGKTIDAMSGSLEEVAARMGWTLPWR